MNEIIKINDYTLELINPHGYCGGVSHALNVVYNTINNPNTVKPIYLLGNLIHNKIVTNKLSQLGVTTIDIKNKTRLELLDYIDSGTVIFSAHGVSNKVREKATNKGLNIVDASCGKVLLIHKKVLEYINKGYYVLYIGKPNHPEAEAILEESNNIKLITSINDLNTKIDNKLIYVTNQTTLSLLEITNIYNKIKELYPNALIDNNICNATTLRQKALFNLNTDLVIVVGDKLSSNSNSLVNIARRNNIDSILVENISDIDANFIKKYKHISFTSGASTPEDIYLSIVDKVKQIVSK